MVNMKKLFWALLPAVVGLVAGGYLLGFEATQTIVGWILVITGGAGLIGGLYNLAK